MNKDEKIIVYLTLTAFETIILFDDEYPKLNSIFKNHATFCLDLTDDVLDKLYEDSDSDLSQFLNGENAPRPTALHDFFEQLDDNNSLIQDKNRSLFFLNVTKEEANNLKNRYGIMVESDSKIDDDIFQLNYNDIVNKNEICKSSKNDENDGFKLMFNDLTFPPSNSVIISDNFIFSHEIQSKSVGYSNIISLLNAILPRMLDIPFHVLIISKHPNKSKETANELIRSLNNEISKLRNYNIMLEVIFSNTLHRRVLISNYYRMKFDKGFEVFSPNIKNKVYDTNEITVTSVFHDPISTKGETGFTMSVEDIQDIKSTYKELQKKVVGHASTYQERILYYMDINQSHKNIDIEKRVVNRLLF